MPNLYGRAGLVNQNNPQYYRRTPLSEGGESIESLNPRVSANGYGTTIDGKYAQIGHLLDPSIYGDDPEKLALKQRLFDSGAVIDDPEFGLMADWKNINTDTSMEWAPYAIAALGFGATLGPFMAGMDTSAAGAAVPTGGGATGGVTMQNTGLSSLFNGAPSLAPGVGEGAAGLGGAAGGSAGGNGGLLSNIANGNWSGAGQGLLSSVANNPMGALKTGMGLYSMLGGGQGSGNQSGNAGGPSGEGYMSPAGPAFTPDMSSYKPNPFLLAQMQQIPFMSRG